MDKAFIDKMAELDDLAPDGVFFCDDGDGMGYDVRKAAEFFKELGLEPGDQLPEEYLEKCRFTK